MANRDIEGPIHRSIIEWLHYALPGALIHHSAAELPLRGGNAPRIIAKAKWNGMLVGFPDILILSHGRVWFLEVKAHGGKASDAQIAVGDRILAQGGRWAVVHSLAAAQAVISRWSREQWGSTAVPVIGTIGAAAQATS